MNTSKPVATRPKKRLLPEKTKPSTETLILDVAESLFAVQGYEGTSMRQIADAADANLGVFHYYWGSKQALCKAVIERRLGPIMLERETRFKAAVKEKRPIEDLLRASLEPSLCVFGVEPAKRESFRTFYGRMLSDPSPEVHAILHGIVDEFSRDFIKELHRRYKGLDDKEFYWRIVFVFGAFFFTHKAHDRILALLGTTMKMPPIEDAVEALIRFVIGGLAAPSPQLPDGRIESL